MIVDRVQSEFAEAVLDVSQAHGDLSLVVHRGSLADIMEVLRQDEALLFGYLVDVTAIDYQPMTDVVDRYQARFMVVYHLYSHQLNARVRLKSPVNDGETVPTMVGLWKAADWLEREVYDMFGIVFEGHPDLCRILMPDDYEGYPLRKDYPLKGRGERSSFVFDSG